MPCCGPRKTVRVTQLTQPAIIARGKKARRGAHGHCLRLPAICCGAHPPRRGLLNSGIFAGRIALLSDLAIIFRIFKGGQHGTRIKATIPESSKSIDQAVLSKSPKAASSTPSRRCGETAKSRRYSQHQFKMGERARFCITAFSPAAISTFPPRRRLQFATRLPRGKRSASVSNSRR